MATVADVRVRGTTRARPIDRFAAETLTPLGPRPAYRFERLRVRQVPADALVSIAAARYSALVRYVGATSLSTRPPPGTSCSTRASGLPAIPRRASRARRWLGHERR